MRDVETSFLHHWERSLVKNTVLFGSYWNYTRFPVTTESYLTTKKFFLRRPNTIFLFSFVTIKEKIFYYIEKYQVL